jgi:serine/threonine protein kinase
VKKMKHVNPRDQFRNLSEVHFLKRVDHPNIVRFISAYTTLDELWIVTEFMEGGTLSQVRYLPSLRHAHCTADVAVQPQERERK